MDSKKTLVLGLGIALIGGFIVYQAFTLSDASSNRSPQVAGTNNNGAADSSTQQAPDFILTTLDGQQLTLSDYRGDKPVV